MKKKKLGQKSESYLQKFIRLSVRGKYTFLESVGVEVSGESANDPEAVRSAHEVQPDAVILEIHMPQLNGIEAMRRIRHDNHYIRTQTETIIAALSRGLNTLKEGGHP